jgi:hypothetical protein
LLEIFVVFFFYNGETPSDGVFDEFDAITPITDSVKTQTYADLVSIYGCIREICSPNLQLTANNEYNLYGLRYLIRVSLLLSIGPRMYLTGLLGHNTPQLLK